MLSSGNCAYNVLVAITGAGVAVIDLSSIPKPSLRQPIPVNQSRQAIPEAIPTPP
jgi:hypothetical protein